MKKRILSILLLCCMVLTLLPTAAFAAGEIDEQFTLAPGGTYYFDLSAMGIPGTVNDALPDKTMRYVPFTYAGTVDSYKLASEMATTEEYAETYKYAHSLFIADFAVTHTVSWDELNAGRLIFGKNYTAGGVDYTMRAPSEGSASTGSGESKRGTPQSNEWDRILDKNWIKFPIISICYWKITEKAENVHVRTSFPFTPRISGNMMVSICNIKNNPFVFRNGTTFWMLACDLS